MNKFEILWSSLKDYLSDKREYAEILEFMEKQENIYGVAKDALNGVFGTVEEELENSKEFLSSILELANASDEEKEELMTLMRFDK